MRDDFEATSSAIWCRAKARARRRLSRRCVARWGGLGRPRSEYPRAGVANHDSADSEEGRQGGRRRLLRSAAFLATSLSRAFIRSYSALSRELIASRNFLPASGPSKSGTGSKHFSFSIVIFLPTDSKLGRTVSD